jgi:hypothetical protein
MTLVCIGMSWVGVKMQKARRQKEAVEAIKALGGSVEYDYQVDAPLFLTTEVEPPTPQWLRRLFGDDLFMNVVLVYLGGNQVRDTDLKNRLLYRICG